MKVLVMGGTRFMGVRVVERLTRDGHTVTLFNRGTNRLAWSQSITEVHGDRNDPASVSQLREHDLDAVIDLSAYTQEQTDRLLDVLGNIDVFVHCSTAAVYRQSSAPLLSEDMVGANPLYGEYGTQKLNCEQSLLQRRGQDLQTTVLRFPYVLGPGNYIPREEFVLNRVLDHEIVFLPGDGQAIQQFIYVDQGANALCAALDPYPRPGWRVLNIASSGCTSSLEEFVDHCAQEVGMEPRDVAVGGGPTGDHSAAFDFANCLFPFPNESCMLDLSAADAAGLIPDAMGLEEMINIAYDALIRDPQRRAWLRTPLEQQALKRLRPSVTPSNF